MLHIENCCMRFDVWSLVCGIWYSTDYLDQFISFLKKWWSYTPYFVHIDKWKLCIPLQCSFACYLCVVMQSQSNNLLKSKTYIKLDLTIRWIAVFWFYRHETIGIRSKGVSSQNRQNEMKMQTCRWQLSPMTVIHIET